VRAQAEVVLGLGAGEDGLGERRAVVGRAGLAAQHPDAALVAGAAQRLRAALPGEPAARDDDPVAHRATASGATAPRAGRRGDMRSTSSAAAGRTTIAVAIRNHSLPASVPSPS